MPAIVTIALALCIKEPHKEAVPQASKFSWSLEGMPDQFKRYLVVAGIFALANSSDMFLLLRAKEAGVPQADIPLLWAGISLITTVFVTPLSALSDQFGRKRFILIAWIAFAFFYIAMGLPNISMLQIFALFGIYGLFKAATEGVEKALVADMAPKGLAGTAFGWFNLVTGLMLFPASFIFGWIYEAAAPLYDFRFSGGCALVGVYVVGVLGL